MPSACCEGRDDEIEAAIKSLVEMHRGASGGSVVAMDVFPRPPPPMRLDPALVPVFKEVAAAQNVRGASEGPSVLGATNRTDGF